MPSVGSDGRELSARRLPRRRDADNLLVAKLLLPFEGRLLAIVLSSAVLLVENHSSEGEHRSGIGLKLFGIIPESRSPCPGFLIWQLPSPAK